MAAYLKTAASLLKLRIGIAIAASALAGMAAAQGTGPGWLRALALAVAVIGASGAAGAFNHYYERKTDRLMARTRQRPFASGMLGESLWWPAAFLGLLAVSLALAWAVSGGMAATYVFLGAFTYGIVYTVWLKRRSVWNIVVGGLAGSFAVLAGAAAVDPDPQAAPVLLALILFLWTPPHFWSLAASKKDDYARAGVPMLPVVASDKAWPLAILGHTIVLVALSIAPLWFGLGTFYGVFAAVGGAIFVWRSVMLAIRPGDRRVAMANFGASLIQLVLLVCGVLLDAASGHSTWPF
ncbi:MAG: heme o synthase [Rhodoblastus sp.]